MKNIEDINKEAVKKIITNKKVSVFSPGDTIKVGVKIVEGKNKEFNILRVSALLKKIEI